MPSFTDAKIGYQGESKPLIPVIPSESEIILSTGAILEIQLRAEEERLKWAMRLNRTSGFWASFMNNRKTTKAFVEQHAIRREKHKEKRLQCRNDVRRANRDNLLSETSQCFKATLTMDLEILRKQQIYVEDIPGVSDQYRTAALFHIQNLMKAISTVVEAIDAGTFSNKEELLDAKVNLESHYRLAKRSAMTKLRIDRSKTWLEHLMIRLHAVLIYEGIPAKIVPKIEETIACLEQKELLLDDLFELEGSGTLEDSFRQVQSDIKFCTEMATSAAALNKELEQAEAENQ